MSPARAALAAISLVLALAGAALAGSKPRVLKVEPPAAFAGGVVEVAGTNFSEVVAEVSARAGGQPCLVLEAAPERLKILLPPALPPGRHPLEVTISGASSDGFEISIRPESERAAKRKQDEQSFEGADAAPPPVKVLQLDTPEPVDDRGSFVIRTSGRASLPDGCVVSLDLKLGNDPISHTEATIESGRFAGTFGPYGRELFAGSYWVYVEFKLEEQAKRIREAFRRQFPDKLELAAREHALDRQACRIGTGPQEDGQAKELRIHVARTIARARSLMRELEEAYASAGRSAFRREGGKVDEASWEEWLAKRSLRGVAADERAARTEVFRKGRRFLTETGEFADQAWREWMDHNFRAEVFALARAHVEYRDRYLIMKHPDTMLHLEELIAMLSALSQARSSDLYRLNSLPVPAQDVDPAAGAPDVLKLSGQRVGAAVFDAQARKIVHELALTPAEEASAEAELNAPEKPASGDEKK